MGVGVRVDTSLASLKKTELCGVRVSLEGLRVEAGGIGQGARWTDVKGRMEQRERIFPLRSGAGGKLRETARTGRGARADVGGCVGGRKAKVV